MRELEQSQFPIEGFPVDSLSISDTNEETETDLTLSDAGSEVAPDAPKRGLFGTILPFEGSEFSHRIAFPSNFAEMIASAALIEGNIVIYGATGLPANGKTAFLTEMDNKMYNPDHSARMKDLSDKMKKEIVVYDNEWGAGYRHIPVRVSGDHHADPVLDQAKREELVTVGGSFFNDLNRAYEAARSNPDRDKLIQVIRFDNPLYTGLELELSPVEMHNLQKSMHEDPELLKRIKITDAARGKIEVGTPRGDVAFAEFVDKMKNEKGVELFVAGMYAKKPVRDHTHQVRMALEQVNTAKKRREVLKEWGTNFNDSDFSDEEVNRYVENMARTFQIATISKDFEAVIDYLLFSGKISYSSATGPLALKRLQDPERREKYFDELAGNAINWILSRRVGVDREHGAVFCNEEVTTIDFRKPVLPVKYITPQDLDSVA